MSETVRDQISAFLDGELADDECELLLRRLDRDSEHSSLLKRYALISEAIRETTVVWAPGLGQRIAEALKNEISYHGRRETRRSHRWVRVLAGVGIAATVAVLAILTMRPGDPGVDGSDSIIAGQIPDDVDVDDFTYVTPQNTERRPTSVPARLTRYMMTHSDYSGALGPSGTVTGIVAQEAETTSPFVEEKNQDANPDTEE